MARRRHKAHVPYDPALKAKARALRADATPAEKRLWREVLSRRRLGGFKFLRQKPLDRYIVDFYCADLRLAIEIDGDSHANRLAYDTERTRRLERLGITVIRYENSAVMNNLDGVHRDLTQRIAANPPRPSLVREGEKSPPDKGDLGGS